MQIFIYLLKSNTINLIEKKYHYHCFQVEVRNTTVIVSKLKYDAGWIHHRTEIQLQ